MKILGSILSPRSRAMLCFLVGVCVSPLLVQWIQVSMLSAKANENGVFVQEPEAGKAPIAKQNLPTQPAGETIPADGKKEGIDATIPSDPKEIVRLYLDSMRKNDQSKMRQLLSSQAIEELKRKQLEIAPPFGSEKATFQVLNAVEESDHTLVESVWEEPRPSSETTTAAKNKSLEIVWELRKESKGWRICGMAIDPKDSTEVQVVDFENLEPSKHDKTPKPLSPAGSYANVDSVTLANPHFDPKQVTRLFLDALKRGDSMQLWVLLSSRARAEIKWNLNDETLLNVIGHRGQVLIVNENEPIKQDGCMLVSSSWAAHNEVPPPSGFGQEIFWKLRWESNGWRIFGFVRDPKKNGYAKDFEQPATSEFGQPVKSGMVPQDVATANRSRIPLGSDVMPGYSNTPMSNWPTTVNPPYSLPRIQNRPSAPQDFELDAEIVAEIKEMVKLSDDRNGSTIYQVAANREVSLPSIAQSGSGLATYVQIQEVLNRTVMWYQAEKDEASKTELHASAIKLANFLFHLQQLKRKSEIGGIEKRLGKLKEIVAAREKMSEQIINSRVSQLLGISDGMGWDDLEVREPQPIPGASPVVRY